MPWPSPAPSSARVGDIVVTADTRADSSPAGAPKGAVLYVTTATLRNTGSRNRVAELRACPFWISVHESGGWYGQEGRPLEWDQLASGKACSVQPATVALSPGQTVSFATSVFAHELLAAKVRPNYRSFFHAHLRIDSAEVVVQADTAVITYPTSGLVPSATSVVAARDTVPTLRTTITLVNRAELPAYLQYGACATRVFAYRTTASDAVPAWDSNKRRLWSTGQPLICVLYLAAATVPAGASLSPPEFTLEVPLMEVLGDSLPDGHYYFKASVGFSNCAPIADIPAGDAELVLARPPLATSRRSFVMQWTAMPVTLSDGAVHAKATGTVVNANSAQIAIERNCPLLIRVYRDRARRDAAPRSGVPDWSQPVCVSDTATQVVVRGETKTFETAVPVRDILGNSLPSGRYYFAVLVKGDGMEMLLSAGDLDLVR